MNAADYIIERLLPNLNEQQQCLIRQHLAQFNMQLWPKGHYFSVTQQPTEHALLICKGLLRSFYLHDDMEVNLRFLAGDSLAAPFASIAQHWLHAQQPMLATENLQSVTVISGYLVPIQYLTDRRRYPEFESLRCEIAAQHYLSMEQRLRMIQQTKAVDRYRNFLAWMPSAIVEKMPNYHVASYLGISPEALSRIKYQLKKMDS